LVETVEGNAGNGADQPRRALSSTERSRAHRARKKREREAALQVEREAAYQKAETAECEVGACCATENATMEGVAEVVASAENAVADAAPGPAEPKVEREAAALHEAGEAEREAGATATIERVADDVASTENTVAGAAPGPADVPADHPAVADIVASSRNGVPAPAAKVWLAWRIRAPAERPARRDWLTISIALAMATVSADFSIYGWTNVYGGAFWPVIALGVVLEAGKLRGVALIRLGRGASWVRLFLVAAVLALMGLNAVGAYGFLAKAHIAHQVESETEVAKRIANIDGRIAEQSAKLADIEKRLGQIDGAINAGIARGKVNAAMTLANDQRNNWSVLEVDRQAVGKVLTNLKVEKAGIEGERNKVEADDLGAVRDLATLLGADDKDVLCRFTLVISLLLDPLAVLLLLAATRTGR
jgi:hypothetical protein